MDKVLRALICLALIVAAVQSLKCVCSRDYEMAKSQQQEDFEDKVQRLMALSEAGNCSEVDVQLAVEKEFLEDQIGLNFTSIEYNFTAAANSTASLCENSEYDAVLRAMKDFYRLLASCVDGVCDVKKSCDDSVVCQEYSKHGHDVERCFHAVSDGKDFRGCQIGPEPTHSCQPNSTETSFDYTCGYDFCNKENQFEKYCEVTDLLV